MEGKTVSSIKIIESQQLEKVKDNLVQLSVGHLLTTLLSHTLHILRVF